MKQVDRPYSLFELGFRLRPIRGADGRSHVYIEPYDVRLEIHRDAKNPPKDGAFEKSTFFLPGGIQRNDGVISAMTCLSNQMIGLIPLHERLFTRRIQPEYPRQSKQKIEEMLMRNRKKAALMLPTRTIRFPR